MMEQKSTDTVGNELTQDQVTEFVLALEPDDILSTYTGKQGCMCGCLGRHRYNPARVAEALAHSSYLDPDSDDFSARSIKLALNRLKKWAKNGEERVVVQDGHIVFVHTCTGRVVSAYLARAK